MHYTAVAGLVLRAALVLASEDGPGDFHAPGRADRMFEKRAPKDFGTFQVDCKGSEAACNNACYYTRCQAYKDPDANKIVFIGPNGNNGEADTNRIESGCNVNKPIKASVCASFPFSQKFASDPTAPDWQCDEWPPAAHQQKPFSQKTYANSLRCMPGPENGSLGAKLGNFINDKGTYPGRPSGVMSRDDFFRVDFLTKIASADQTKVKFCLGQNQINCGQDGFQFGLKEKPDAKGKISAPYDLNKDDNKYALQNSAYAELYQCQVKFTRDGDEDFKNVILADWENKDVQTTKDCSIKTNGGTCTLKGLPNDLTIKRTGALGTKIEFQYSDQNNVNEFSWDSETSGNGRGPWTDPATDPNRKPLRYCKVILDQAKKTEDTECWFPCYKKADGM